ncbi:MAG: YsnF/AvaK domain-containing protein [Oscillatoriales cyanobacterium RM2_1_1]|nr:YsnF/AvaK domain-containing protein [Oscillatoriales cyanobacterium SM2_3_0]NJO44638.1 YsnF/AvaK domain-containing protein [Oscillatoriales cyanobacterium RM2_1_1]
MTNLNGRVVTRDDGTTGMIVGETGEGRWIIEFQDEARMIVSPDVLVLQSDGSYRLFLATPGSSAGLSTAAPSTQEEMVIQVLAEELTVETQKVERGRVRVHKRIESWDETVDTPTIHEEVVVEHVPLNQLIEAEVPEPREEDGVLIIPLIEEVLVVEKRLMLREEVRVTKHRTTEPHSQTVTLRREVVEIERIESNGAESVSDGLGSQL